MQSKDTPASKPETTVGDDEPPLPGRPQLRSVCARESRVVSEKPALFSGSPQWKDWHWQLRNRIRDFPALAQIFPSLEISAGMVSAAARFPFAITPYYASLIARAEPGDPVFMMAVPHAAELLAPPFLNADPLEEERHMPIRGLVHRYPDRALLIATSACPMYCRHCTRKRVTGTRESRISPARLRRTVEYLGAHPEIRDVIISGGDPLTMPTAAVEEIVSAVRAVPSVEVIRIGTRAPVTLPQRITDELVEALRRYHPVWLNTHFNHPNEITAESREACARIADAGIPLGNQTVLLKGINDDPVVMERLLRELIRARVRPYYIFQCDLVAGVEHFRTPLARGIEIMEWIRGRLSGIAIPDFVVDLPRGGGKVPVLPNYIVSSSPSHTVLRSSEGKFVSYPEPCAGDSGPCRFAMSDGPEPARRPARYGVFGDQPLNGARPGRGPSCDDPDR